MIRRAARTGRGFTLVEVVVAIALFAMLMSLVYGVFGIAVRAHDAGAERTDRGTSMRVVSEFLRASIAAASPVAALDGREWSILFGGDGERLGYVTDLPGHVGAGGLHQILLELEAADGKHRLVMRRRPLLLGEDGEPAGEYHSRVLLADAGELAVRYFGSVDGEDPRWHEEWAQGRTLPRLVELGISPRDGDPWPVLRVRPRVDTVRYLGNGPRRGGQLPAGGAGGAAQEPPDQPAAGGATPPAASQ